MLINFSAKSERLLNALVADVTDVFAALVTFDRSNSLPDENPSVTISNL